MITLQIKPSKLLFVFFMLVYVLLEFCVLISNAAVFIKLCLSATLLFYMFAAANNVLLRSANSCNTLKLQSEDWLIQQKNGQLFSAKLKGSSTITPFIMILNFKLETKFWSKTILLLAQNTDADSYHKLYVYLKL
jgi:hypothetical protein